MKDNGKMILEKDMEYLLIIIEFFIKVNLMMRKWKELEYLFMMI